MKARVIALLPFWLTALICFIVYLPLTPNYPTGIGDADEITLMAYLGGVAHPPGFVLQVAILSALIRLLPFISPAYLANVFSAVCMALAVGIVSLISDRFILVNLTQSEVSSKIRILSSVTAGLLLGTSLWVYFSALHAEIFSFAALLAGLCLFSAFKFYSLSKFSRLWWYLTWFLAALGLAHLPTVLVIYPALLLVLTAKLRLPGILKAVWPRHLLGGLSIWGAAFITHLFLLLYFNAAPVQPSWNFDPSLAGAWHHYLRTDYSGFQAETNTSRPAYLLQVNLASLKAVAAYLTALMSTFPPLFGFLILIGAGLSFKFKTIPRLALLLTTALAGPVFAALLGQPAGLTGTSLALAQGIVQRQYLLGLICYIPLIALALFWIYARLNIRYNWLLSVCLLGLCVGLHFNLLRSSMAPVLANYAHDMLHAADLNSIIICNSDLSCYPLWYAGIIDHIRPDVTVISSTSKYHQNLPAASSSAYLSTLVTQSLQDKTVYLTTPTTDLIRRLGLDGDPFVLWPSGTLFAVELQPSALPLTLKESRPTRLLSESPPSPRLSFLYGINSYFANMHSLNANLALRYADAPAFRQSFTQLTVLPDTQDMLSALSRHPFPATPAAGYRKN